MLAKDSDPMKVAKTIQAAIHAFLLGVTSMSTFGKLA
jgi:hypothetical protein